MAPEPYIPSMLLVIDIGNTNAVYGLYRDRDLLGDFRIATPQRYTADEAGLSILHFLERNKVAAADITKVVIGSVVPHLTPIFERTARRYLSCEPVTISHRLNLPITIEIDSPDQVGADRIANAVAAFTRWGGPAIIVDLGTATTFDVVDARGAYIGGVIIAGPETAMGELSRRAARLFEVRIEKPDSVVGKSTAGALKSGAFYGLVGQVDYIIDKILEECGFASCKVAATGGLALEIEKHSRHISEVVPALTLEGLRIIGEGN